MAAPQYGLQRRGTTSKFHCRAAPLGRLNVYPPRGAYSLIVERLEPVGLGALLAKLEALKAELAARGWFDRARAVPGMPRLVGVATSRDGAALPRAGFEMPKP